MKVSPLSNEIFLSRDAIRAQLVEELKQYLDLVDVDLTKSSFVSYIINILATLTSNILFYQISVYREFFLTKAQLNNSVMDLAASIGYNPSFATNSTINLLLSFPFRFTDEVATFIIPKYSKFSVNNISFLLNYNLKVIVEHNSIVKAYKYDDEISENVIVQIDTEQNIFNIMITVQQFDIEKFEFSVYKNNMEYQFTEYNLRLKGQLSKIEVKVVEPGNDIEYIYTQFSSLYLMTSDDKGYVVRKSDDGQKLYFGNGLIGYQPPENSIIYVKVFTTLGDEGNVISGLNFERPSIYAISNTGIESSVIYKTYNPSIASGGKNEPTLEEIKYKAIDNLTTLERLVSENDYKVVGNVINNTPISENTYPVLKRSDIRTNEIQMFSVLIYKQKIVPTENIYITIDPTICENIDCTSVENVIKINKYQEFEYHDDIYIIPFNLEINRDLEITHYKYIISSIINHVKLISVNISLEEYNFFADYVVVKTNEKTINIKIFFQTTETDFDVVMCNLQITNTLISQNMTINTLDHYFEISFTPYDILPENEETYYFTFTHPTLGRLNQYSVSFIFRKNLDHVMLSNTINDIDNNSLTIYDIPVIQKDFYDNLENKADFEYNIIHKMIDNITFSDIRMITDFVNIKFANTSKYLRNMLLNKETKLPIDYIDLEYLDHIPQLNNRYIISGTELPEWKDKIGYIATCAAIDTTSGEITWTYVKPEMDDFVYVKNTQKKYLYTSCDWIEPIYEIPLKIDIDIKIKENYITNIQDFIDTVKKTIVDEYSERMVCQSYLSRSELISTIQQIDGVDHCRLIKPASNIFYNFKLEYLTEEELLQYTPELLYFGIDDISIRLVS